jgi:hypothetical protein
LLVSGSAPELGTAYSDLGHRRGYCNHLVRHLFELARRKKESALSCMQQRIADSSVRIEHVLINNETGVFAKR